MLLRLRDSLLQVQVERKREHGTRPFRCSAYTCVRTLKVFSLLCAMPHRLERNPKQKSPTPSSLCAVIEIFIVSQPSRRVRPIQAPPRP